MATDHRREWIESRSNQYWQREQSRLGRVVNDVVGAVDNAIIVAGTALTFSRSNVNLVRESIKDFREAKQEWRRFPGPADEWIATNRSTGEAAPDHISTDQPSVSKALQAHLRDVQSYSEMLAQRLPKIEAEQSIGSRAEPLRHAVER